MGGVKVGLCLTGVGTQKFPISATSGSSPKRFEALIGQDQSG